MKRRGENSIRESELLKVLILNYLAKLLKKPQLSCYLFSATLINDKD